MMLRPARLALLWLVLFLLWPTRHASTTETPEVDDKIDRITEPPEYDWLRGKSGPAENDAPSDGEGARAKGSASAKPRGDRGCDFSPSISPPPGNQASPSASRSCGGTPADCSRSGVGSCDCSAPIGSCGASGIGVLSSVGYLMVGVFLALLIGLTAAAIIKRRQRETEETVLSADEIRAPGDVRPSEVPKFSVSAMMDRARAAASSGDYKNAVGFAYLAGIDHLHRAGLVDLRRSTTNQQIADAVARLNGLHPAVKTLIRVFEDLFFGAYRAGPDHWETCRQIVEEAFAKVAIQD